MLKNLNDSKAHYFTWVIVTLVIFAAGVFGMFYLFSVSEEKADFIDKIVFGILLPYVISSIPIGWCFRRQLMKGYLHVPTERIKTFETNLAKALCRIFLCEIVAIIDLAILLFYTAFAIVTGPFVFIYVVISGIVFLAKNKI